MTMIIKEGTDVYTAADESVGSVDRVVLDPLTRDLSHVVVRKGIFFPEDKVIPVEAIATAAEERINLRSTVEADDLPPFEEHHFVPMVEGEYPAGLQETAGIPLAYYGPYATLTPAFTSVTRTVTERNIPDRAVALQAGAPVIGRTNDVIGRCDEVIATASGVVTHMVIATEVVGVPAGRITTRKAVPISWVEFATDEKVKLGVSGTMMDAVPAYDPEDSGSPD